MNRSNHKPSPFNVWFLVSLLSALFWLTSPASAQTSFPMITHVQPVALERGKTTVVSVDGQQNFLGVYKALFEGTGITAEVIEEAPPKAAPPQKPLVKSVKLKVTVAADAALGVREFRLASKLGISSVGQLVLVADPVVAEGSVNNTIEQATSISLPCVVAGRLEALEDVDYFKFQAKEDERLTFEVFCARIQDKIHDLQKHAKPMLVLYDAEGRELAANDCFFFADPLLTFTVPKTGTYSLQIRESTYDGDQRWVYAIVATNKPYASHVYPMAGQRGQAIEVEPIGSARAVKPRVPLSVPKDLGVHQLQLDLNGRKTNPVTFIVSALSQVLEQEPNDSPDKATRLTIPCGINGRIDKKRDLDHFGFKAAKGKPIRFEAKARRFGTLLNSTVHAVLDVMDAKGKTLASNDDSHGKEAALVFTPPADSDFVLRVRDLNSKGGETAVYFVEADWSLPDFTIRCDPDKAMIGPGSSTAWYVHIVRTGGFTGPVKVEIEGLLKDVSASPLTIPPAMTQGMIVLTASPNAAINAQNVKVIGSVTIKTVDGKEEIVARPTTSNQEIYFPGGGRGRFDVNLQTVAVTEPSDILKVNVSTTNITLKPGQEVKIDVTLDRRADYDKGVSMDVILGHLGTIIGNPLPPGVTVVPGKSKTLLGTASKGHITLKAAPNAEPIENIPICVLAHVSINFVVKISYASPPILLSVKK